MRFFGTVAIVSACCATVAQAAVDNCSNGGPFVVESQKDADVLNGCKDIKGDVQIAPSATGNISFSGLRNIDGGLYTLPGNPSSPPALVGVWSDSLVQVKGSVALRDMPALQSVGLTALELVGGPLALNGLPVLNQLRLDAINSISSFSIVGAPKLLDWTVGPNYVTTESNSGLKKITGSGADGFVEVRDVGVDTVFGILGLYNTSRVVLEDLPNLHSVVLFLGHIGEVRIRGNGNLTLYMTEKGAFGDMAQPVMERLDISGVKHISPCVWPDVWDFVATNNTVEYLHFGFYNVRSIDVRSNPRLKTLVPWNGGNLWQWRLVNMRIEDNPLLKLSRNPVRVPEDNLTALDCPFMYKNNVDKWEWYPFKMDSLVINASVDDTFFASWRDMWQKPLEMQSRAQVFKDFNVTSSDPKFDCSELDQLRANRSGAFPGEYTCQGNTLPAAPYNNSSLSWAVRASHGAMAWTWGALCLVALLHL